MSIIVDIEGAILKALTAYKVEKGLTEADAALWAEAHLQDGVTRFKASLSDCKKDLEICAQSAFSALKAWAQA